MLELIKEEPHSYAEQFLMPLRQWLVDPEIIEVVINPDGCIYTEHSSDKDMKRLDIELKEDIVTQIGSQLAAETRNPIGKKHPIVSGRICTWNEKIRVQIVVPPAVECGASVTIRKYSNKRLDTSKIKFLDGAHKSAEEILEDRNRPLIEMRKNGELDKLLQYVIDNKFNILISGGTSSGKTTLARELLAKSNQQERLITIEDALELNPTHCNCVSLVSDRRENSEQLPAKLLESALRMRPDRLILGEIRGVEAYDFLESINTGHPGAISTIHADSPQLAFDRLALMVLRTGIKLRYAEIIDYARKSIDIVIQLGRASGQRGIKQIFFPAIDSPL